MTTREIEAIKEKYDLEYAVVAVRTQEEPFNLGPIAHRSKIWDNEDETSEELNGISATALDSGMVHMHTDGDRQYGYYFGGHKAIICGNNYVYGDDPGEVIISDPVVVEIIK